MSVDHKACSELVEELRKNLAEISEAFTQGQKLYVQTNARLVAVTAAAKKGMESAAAMIDQLDEIVRNQNSTFMDILQEVVPGLSQDVRDEIEDQLPTPGIIKEQIADLKSKTVF